MANKSNCYKVKGTSIASDQNHAELKSEESPYFKGLFGPKFKQNSETIIPWAGSIAPVGFTINGELLDIALPATIPTFVRGSKAVSTSADVKDKLGQKVDVLAGYNPSSSCTYTFTHPNKDRIVCTYNSTTKEATSSYFKNNIVPTRLLIFLQGAGGGGGGGDYGFGGQPGAGGGAGGFWYGIVRFEIGDKIQITTGVGGAGGEANANDADDNKGKNGGQSKILYIPNPNSSRKEVTITVNGGTGGEGGESGDNHKAGIRGTIEIKQENTLLGEFEDTDSVWTLLSSDWTNITLPGGGTFKGGNGTGGVHFENGSGHEEIVLAPYTTPMYNKLSTIDGNKVKTISFGTVSGGSCQRGGGGASSIFAVGGKGGDNGLDKGDGGNGKKGSGGGGGADTGHWDYVAGKGGRGGDAVLLVW